LAILCLHFGCFDEHVQGGDKGDVSKKFVARGMGRRPRGNLLLKGALCATGLADSPAYVHLEETAFVETLAKAQSHILNDTCGQQSLGHAVHGFERFCRAPTTGAATAHFPNAL
jgi:hypothetical protein